MQRFICAIFQLITPFLAYGQIQNEKQFIELLLDKKLVIESVASKIWGSKLFLHNFQFFGRIKVLNMNYGGVLLSNLRRFIATEDDRNIVEVNTYHFKRPIDVSVLNEFITKKIDNDDMLSLRQFIEEFENLSQYNTISISRDMILGSIEKTYFSMATKSELFEKYNKIKLAMITRVSNEKIIVQYISVNLLKPYLVYENRLVIDGTRIIDYSFSPLFSEKQIRQYFWRQ